MGKKKNNKISGIILLFIILLYTTYSGILSTYKNDFRLCFRPLLRITFISMSIVLFTTTYVLFLVIAGLVEKKVNNKILFIGKTVSILNTIVVIFLTITFTILVRSVKMESTACTNISNLIQFSNTYLWYGIISSVYILIITISQFVIFNK